MFLCFVLCENFSNRLAQTVIIISIDSFFCYKYVKTSSVFIISRCGPIVYLWKYFYLKSLKVERVCFFTIWIHHKFCKIRLSNMMFEKSINLTEKISYFWTKDTTHIFFIHLFMYILTLLLFWCFFLKYKLISLLISWIRETLLLKQINWVQIVDLILIKSYLFFNISINSVIK